MDTNAKVVISAKAQGFEEAQRKIVDAQKTTINNQKVLEQATKKAQEAADKFYKGFSANVSKLTYKDYIKELNSLDNQLGSVAKQQISVMKALQETKEGTDEYKALNLEVKALENTYNKVTKAQNLLTRAFKEHAIEARKAEQSSGAFTQGLLQGAVPSAAYLQRGPGAARQAAGAYIGAHGRQMAGGMASMPFTGASGLSQALAGIPVVGGFLAGQLQTGMGYAHSAMQAQQSRLGLAPYLASTMQGVNAAGIAAGSTYSPDAAQRMRDRARNFVRGIPGSGLVGKVPGFGDALGLTGDMLLGSGESKDQVVARARGSAYSQ